VYTTIVADRARGESFTLGPSTLGIRGGTGGALLAQEYARPAPGSAGGVTGLFTTSSEGPLARAIPRPLHARVSRGAVSREGSLAAAWDGQGAGPLLAGTSGSRFREVARGRFVEAGFAPDGSAVYALGWLQPAYERLQENWYRPGFSRPPEGRSGRSAVADLIRVPLDGSAPKVVFSPLDLCVFSVSEQGVLVYDADSKLLLVPLGGGPPVEMLLPDDSVLRDARVFDSGIVTVVAPAAMLHPPSGIPYNAPWLAEANVQGRPGAAPRRAATLRLSSRTEVGIVGLTHDGAVTLAWHADLRETALWVVKTIAPDGSARVLADRASPEVSYGEPVWDNKEAVTPTEGAALP
jgi:hypothetical protein